MIDDRHVSESAPVRAQLFPRWFRLVSWIGPLGLGIALLGGFAVIHLHAAPGGLDGGVSDERPAPDFSLTDQTGQPQDFADFRGRVVALTFIYTNCGDICPIIAWNMHLAHEQLGKAASDVALVAVTVDPERDTPAQMRAFTDQKALTNQWHFLTGMRPVLDDVWRSYGITVLPVDSDGRPIDEDADLMTASPEQIEHAAPTFLIDREHRIRYLLPSDFTADTLTHDLQALLAE